MFWRRVAPKELDREGREIANNKGYKYFGAAKDLPGVRELFVEKPEVDPNRKNRSELMKHVNADYYGYMDDDDGLLVPLEEESQQIARMEGEKVFICPDIVYFGIWLGGLVFVWIDLLTLMLTQQVINFQEWEENKDKWRAKKADEEDIDIYKVKDVSFLIIYLPLQYRFYK